MQRFYNHVLTCFIGGKWGNTDSRWAGLYLVESYDTCTRWLGCAAITTQRDELRFITGFSKTCLERCATFSQGWCHLKLLSRKKPYWKTTPMWTRKQSNYQNFVLCMSGSDQEWSQLASMRWLMTCSQEEHFQVLSFVPILAKGCLNINSSLLLHIAVLCFPLMKMQILTPNVGGETN